MGKSKGGKYFKKAPRKGPGDPESDSEEEYTPANRGLGGQAATAGMLPPSDSEEEDEEEGEEKPKPAAKPAAPKASASKAKDDDSEESGSDEDSDSSDDGPVNEYLSAPRQPKKKEAEEDRDPETIRKDLERLELIRKKREDDRLKRIRDEGWDRFAPISDTNRPPGYVPSDHPSQKA